MNQNDIAISSLAMDLKRVALGYYKGSENTAKRFSQEALARCKEIDEAKPYLRKIIDNLPTILNQKDKKKVAEDALTYSIIFQNYVVVQKH